MSTLSTHGTQTLNELTVPYMRLHYQRWAVEGCEKNKTKQNKTKQNKKNLLMIYLLLHYL